MFSFLNDDKHQQVCQMRRDKQNEEYKRNILIVSEANSQVQEKTQNHM